MTRLRAFLACFAIASALVLVGTLDAQDEQQHAASYVPPYLAKLNAP